jgi:DNA-directed RNA polymerase specialized sigma24 family protein
MKNPITAHSFTEMYRQYSAWIRHKVLRKGIPLADVDDVASLAWLYVWKYRSKYDGRHHIQIYLSLNVRSACGLYWRTRSTQPETTLVLEDIEFDEKHQPIGYAPRSQDNPEMTAIVRDVLGKMPSRWRSVLEADARGDLDSLITEIGAPATFQLLYRARQRFREIWNNGVVKDKRRCAAAA